MNISNKISKILFVVLITISIHGKTDNKLPDSKNSNLEQIESVPGEYIVRLKHSNSNLSSMNMKLLSQSLGSYIKSRIPAQNIVIIKRPTFETKSSVINTLSNNPLVDVVEPNFIYKANRLPNDPLLVQLWGMKNTAQKDSGGQPGTAGIDIGAEQAWDIETGSDKMLVAVIDTGVDFDHPDLVNNIWTNEAELNGVVGIDDDNNGVIDDIHGFNAVTGKGDAKDDHGHGTHCAGTIGGSGNDGKGIVGVNWNVKIMAVKFLASNGSGSLENALKAIDYATKMGAKVLSNSWGGGGFSQTLLDSIKRSNEAGALFVAAAGNDGSNNDTKPSYPASYDVPNIISVAAITNRGDKATFTNYGKRSVHLGAPGVNVYSSILAGGYQSMSGTSMAAPHVSGVAALVWAHEPNLTAQELKTRLLKTVRPIPSLKGITKTGGMVNAFFALTNKTPDIDVNDPVNWPTKPVDVASASPYLKNTSEVFEIKVDGAKEFAVYFEKFETESNYDFVKLIVGDKVIQSLSGDYEDSFSQVITGDSVKIEFKSDDSTEKSGWKITKVAYR